MLHESNNISSKWRFSFFLPMDAAYFQDRNSKWPAGIPLPLCQLPLKWTELSLPLRQHFPVPQKDDFPVFRQWRIFAAALVTGLRSNTCSSRWGRAALVGDGTIGARPGEKLPGNTGHSPAPQRAPGGAGWGSITAWPGVWAEILQAKDRWKDKGLSSKAFSNEESCFENWNSFTTLE